MSPKGIDWVSGPQIFWARLTSRIERPMVTSSEVAWGAFRRK